MTLIETVARAIVEAGCGDLNERTYARAAIAAMALPTKGMLEAGFMQYDCPPDVWQAMIHAALAEGEGLANLPQVG